MTDSEPRDFFISFNRADEEWAQWIAWVLEEAGYKVIYQDWDFVPGANFIIEMQRAVIHARRTVLVLSDSAIRSDFVTAEWAAAMSADPSGAKRKLIPVRVRPLTLPLGLLGQVVYVDLVDLGRDNARNALLGALRKRRKPSTTPAFPDQKYPGRADDVDLSGRLRKRLEEIERRRDADGTPSAADRRRLTDSLGKLGVGHFNILLEALDVPSGAVPPMPADQADRIRSFLDWADGERPGLATVATLTAELRSKPTAAVPLDQRRKSRLAVNAIDSCDGVLEEIDELGHAYIAVEQWSKAFLTYRTLVDLAAEQDTLFYARGLARLGEVHWRYGEEANAEESWRLSGAVYRSLGRWAKATQPEKRAKEVHAEAARMEEQANEVRTEPAGRSGASAT